MLAVLLTFALASSPSVRPAELPPDVDAFVRDREMCDHFRGEPTEGSGREEVARRDYVRGSVEIYCPGTDRRLAALKRRYAGDPAIVKVLASYDDRIGL